MALDKKKKKQSLEVNCVNVCCCFFRFSINLCKEYTLFTFVFPVFMLEIDLSYVNYFNQSAGLAYSEISVPPYSLPRQHVNVLWKDSKRSP